MVVRLGASQDVHLRACKIVDEVQDMVDHWLEAVKHIPDLSVCDDGAENVLVEGYFRAFG